MKKSLKYLTSTIVLILILCTSCVANAAFKYTGENVSGLKSITKSTTAPSHTETIEGRTKTFSNQKVYFTKGWFYKDYNSSKKYFFPSAGGVTDDKQALYKEAENYKDKIGSVGEKETYSANYSKFRFRFNLNSLLQNQFLYCVRHDLTLLQPSHIYRLSSYVNVKSKSLSYALASGKQNTYTSNNAHRQDEGQKAIWGLYSNSEMTADYAKIYKESTKLAQIADRYEKFIDGLKEQEHTIKYDKQKFENKEESDQYVIGPFTAKFPYNDEENITYYKNVSVSVNNEGKVNGVNRSNKVNETVETNFADCYLAYVSGKTSDGKDFQLKVTEYRDKDMKKIKAPISEQEFYIVVSKTAVSEEGITIGDKAKFTKYEMRVRLLGAEASIYRFYDYDKSGTQYQTLVLVDEAERKYTYTKMTVNLEEKITEKTEIAGTVWVDEGATKGNDLDYVIGNKFDGQAETRLEGISVKLYGAIGGTRETKTDAQGNYSFKDVPIDGIENFNVEFEYNGQKYEPVEPLKEGKINNNTGVIEYINVDKYNTIVSKAKEDALTRKNYNSKFSEITSGKTASGYTLNYDTKVENGNKISTIKYDNDELYNIKSSTTAAGIKFDKNDLSNEGYRLHVNLGLKKRPEFDLYLYKNIYQSNVKVNNVDDIIDYDKRNGIGYDENGWAQVGVKETSMKEELYNEISKDKLEALKEVANESTEVQEQRLQVYLTYVIGVKNESGVDGIAKEVVDYYDDIYQVESVKYAQRTRNSFETTDEKVSYSDKSRYGNEQKFAGKNALYIQNEKKLSNGEFYYILVTLKLKNPASALLGLYTDNQAKVESINFAEINGYATEEGLIDKDSAPGNFDVANYKFKETAPEDDEATSPAYIYKMVSDIPPAIPETPPPAIPENGQVTITGVVWEDATTVVDNVRSGNGEKDEGEKNIKGVTVKLVNNENATKIATTAEDGRYTFANVPKGNYTIQYTYGSGDSKDYNAQDFSSTKAIKVAENDVKWYNNNGNKIVSAARDNVKERNKINNDSREMTNDTYWDLDNKMKNGELSMTADTPPFDIDDGQEGTININFGIAERPHVKVEIKKSIIDSDLKIKLANGTEIKQTLGLAGAENNVHKIGLKTFEIDDSQVQGATLYIKYNYTIKNNSENGIDVQANVLDYIPNGLLIDLSSEENKGWQKIDTSQVDLKDKYKLNANVDLSNQNTILEATEENPLISKLKAGAEAATTMQLSVNLAPDSDNLSCKSNVIEIVKLINDEGRKDKESVPGKFNPNDNDYETAEYDDYVGISERVAISPATGQKDINYKWTLTALFSALIIATGVILIKRKV